MKRFLLTLAVLYVQSAIAQPPIYRCGGEYVNSTDGRPDASQCKLLSPGSPTVVMPTVLPPCSSDKSTWRDRCWGTVTYRNGAKYVGEFRDRKLHGQGTLTYPDGSKYVGEYRDNKKDGQGAYTNPDGSKYVGEYRDGEIFGEGIRYRSDGAVLSSGRYEKDRLVQSYAIDPLRFPFNSQPLAKVSPSSPAIGASAGASATNRVKLISSGGTFKVPVRLNDQFNLNFTVDSGAADVSVPADVVLTLVRTGTIGDGDFRGEQTYVLADGSRVKSRTFILRELKVGNQTVHNVEASVADVQGSLLLGQSFLKKFKFWAIDNSTHELVLQ